MSDKSIFFPGINLVSPSKKKKKISIIEEEKCKQDVTEHY
jgi:hypothetical protein